MTTKTFTDQMHGQTLLFDARSNQLMRGQICIKLDTDQASIQLENDVTGITDTRHFTSPDQIEVINWIIGAVQDTHTDVDLGISQEAPATA